MVEHLKEHFFSIENKIRMIIHKSKCIKARILVINQCYSIRSLYNYFIVLLFENFGYTMWNESFEFLLGKCQRVMGLYGSGSE